MVTIHWLAWCIVGGIAGWLASMVTKTRREFIMDSVVGIVGAFIAGSLLNALGTSGTTSFNIWSVFGAFIGAVELLAVRRLVSRSGSSVA